ncbi:MAG: Rpn family recombination-promoting nuclease/putative transposase [Alkalispirochaeta sp.]
MKTVRESGQETTSGRADLVLTVETTDGTTEYVYVLVEHKSYRDRTVAVQLLGYVAGIMERYRTLPIPVVHPVVFYHGEPVWTVPTELTDLHRQENEPPGGYPVNLRYHLFDLSTIPPEQIAARTRARAYAGMITLKYVLRHKLDDPDIRIIGKVIARARLPEDIWKTMTIYLFEYLSERYKQPLLTEIEENVYTEEEGKRMRSIADAMREDWLVKGIEQGLEQGFERGKADVLVRLLRRRFGLSEEEEAVVRGCRDVERLDEAAERCVDLDVSKDEILSLLM